LPVLVGPSTAATGALAKRDMAIRSAVRASGASAEKNWPVDKFGLA